MTRLISVEEEQESRLLCKGCRSRVAFTREDIQLNEKEDRYITCPSCNHINILQFHNDDPRNIIDEYKHLPNEEIKKRLKEKAFPYAIMFEHWTNDFNISGVFRTANVFGAEAIYYVGGKRFDRRGCQGCYNYQEIVHLKSLEALKVLKERYTIIAVDNIEGSKPIESYQYPRNPLFCFGSESDGLSKELLDMADEKIYIPQYGSVRSLNCSVAAGIVLHDFVRKFQKQ